MPNTIAENLQRLVEAKADIAAAITTRGGTVASGDGLEDFANDIAAIPNTYAAGDEGKVVQNGALVAQTSATFTENGTYDTTGISSITIAVPVPVEAHTYGVVWDKTQSSPQLTRTDESANFDDPDPYVEDGNHPGSSPFDTLMPWAGMEKEIIDGNVLVKIPKFWYKITNDSSQLKIQISDKAQEGFKVSPAHQARNANESDRDYVYIGRYKCSSTDYKSQSGKAPKTSITRETARTSIASLGTGYYQQDFATFWTIRLLYLVEFANWNSQEKIGFGCGNGVLDYTGKSDSMPYHTGTMQVSRTTYGTGTQYRWIEDLWGNALEFVDGIYFSSSSVYIITNPSNFSDTTGGTLVGTRATSSNEIKDFFASSEATLDWVMYPNAVYSDSNYSTYVADRCSYYGNGVVLCVGGFFNQSQDYGLFYMGGSNSASESTRSIGTRLMYLP